MSPPSSLSRSCGSACGISGQLLVSSIHSGHLALVATSMVLVLDCRCDSSAGSPINLDHHLRAQMRQAKHSPYDEQSNRLDGRRYGIYKYRADHATEWEAMRSVARKLGIGSPATALHCRLTQASTLALGPIAHRLGGRSRLGFHPRRHGLSAARRAGSEPGR
jgi:hypothetical protein